METSSVPVTWDGLRGEGDLDTEFFSDTVEEETRHPQLVTHYNKVSIHTTHVGRCDNKENVHSMPVQGPTWYSHWAGMTSALIPEMLMSAYRQAL